ncbi:hypothetical protein, partial [Mesorhizobium sp. M7A.T.Ca.US.000.02.1.1]|uniref:hypothetical protein n=1 Tax=Mesorhizobium sp. M7A.T.Ca.US.000.02.1.1 TaxID=2496792 RepID=UPI001FE0593E
MSNDREEGFAAVINFLVNQFLPRRDQAMCPNMVHQGERLMFTVSRNVLLAAIAVSVLAGCKTTAPRECDKLKPGVTYNGKCCGIGEPCREGKGGGGRPG